MRPLQFQLLTPRSTPSVSNNLPHTDSPRGRRKSAAPFFLPAPGFVHSVLNANSKGHTKPRICLHSTVLGERDSRLAEPGVVVCAGSSLTVNVVLRRWSMVHYGCKIGHEAEIGIAAVLNPGADIAGGVCIGARCAHRIGSAGTAVRDGRRGSGRRRRRRRDP